MNTRFLSFALVLIFWFAGAQAQTTTDLTVEQAREIALQALFARQPRPALEIAEAILAQIPDDRGALMIIAAAAPQVGDPDRGGQAGAGAWALSLTDIQLYEAARLTASAAVTAELYTNASFWLRRALNVAPNDQERQRTLNDARAVTRTNPWSSRLSFSLAPSTNLNGGADDDEYTIEGVSTQGDPFEASISEDGLALAGWRATLNASTQYRFFENAQNRASVGLAYQGVRVHITEDTKVTDEALRTDVVQLSLRYDRALENGALGVTLSEAFFQYRVFDRDSLESDVEDYRTTRLGVDRRLTLSDRAAVALSASRERVLYSDTSNIPTLHRSRIGAAFTYVLDSRDRIGVNLSFGLADSDSPNSVQRDQSVSFSYTWAEPIGPVTLSAGVGATWRNYPDYLVIDPGAPFSGFVPLEGGRDDQTLSANLNIGFPQVEYFGFRPGVRIDAERTNSNVSRFETTRVSAGFTLTSVF